MCSNIYRWSQKQVSENPFQTLECKKQKYHLQLREKVFNIYKVKFNKEEATRSEIESQVPRNNRRSRCNRSGKLVEINGNNE
jgi:hypothetical protein